MVWLTASAAATLGPSTDLAAASARTTSFNWVEQHPARSPSARDSYAFAYDAATKQLLLLAGENANGNAFDDTWLWAGKTWRKAVPKVGPPATLGAAIAYDTATKQLIMFGGQSTSGKIQAATWEWTGTTWKKLSSKTSPPALSYAACAYDAKSKQLIVFGGYNSSFNGSDQTWEWTGTTWKKLSPKTSPPALAESSMAYDPNVGSVLLFGGLAGNPFGPSSQTWTWSGANWTHQSPKTSPPSRIAAAMTFDNSTKQLLLFGGAGPTGTDGGGVGILTLSDTWTWSGSTWSELKPKDHPAGRAATSVAFDGSTDQLLLFGGASSKLGTDFSDTWLWEPQSSS